MYKLLLIGVNTRAMINSGLKLDYDIYSSSYYKTYDSAKVNETYILKQKANKSCGYFEEEYNPIKLLNKSKEFLEICDYIILCSGISPNDFTGEYEQYLKKIIGNINTQDIEDKYRFYKKNSNEFLIPETFNKIDIYECLEIIKNKPNTSYIAKPTKGSGGYGVYVLNNKTINQYKSTEKLYENFMENKIILQEHINGTNISSSTLSTKKETKTLINSRLLNQKDYNENSYKYSGNILPLNEKTLKYKNKKENIEKINTKTLNTEINEISEKIIKKLKLIGNNGVDMIIDPKGEIYIIEVNPRLQGTYESIEKLLNINLLEAHIKACNGELIKIGKYKGYSFKKLLYTEEKVKIKNLQNKNIYDIPYPNTIFEKNQPLVSIITKDTSLEKVKNNIKISENKVKENIKLDNTT